MKTIFIVMDSLNRHYLKCYNQDSWIKTPNIDKLVGKSVVFDNHYAGSLPCMPARREMMTGRSNFLETPWSPIQPWDYCLPTELRKQCGTFSNMITDHYHYFHAGGEGYHTLFDAYEFERGQEGDAWKPVVDAPEAPEGTRGKGLARKEYWRNLSMIDPEDDLSYPTPRCFKQAMDFVDINHSSDNWHLHLEVFDPHEPFDCPRKYRDMYDDNWDKYRYTWPEYAPLDPEHDDEDAIEHIRKCYAATLTMADHWLGQLLDKIDQYSLWDDVRIVLTTDHGHLLGEHGYWAKNYMFDYQELANIPLIAYSPSQRSQKRVSALTATIDLMPTFMDWFGAECPVPVHGKSIVPLIESDNDSNHHDAVLFGYFAKTINMVDGQYTYCRQPIPDSSLYHYTGCPRSFVDFYPKELLAKADMGRYLEQFQGIPAYRIKCDSYAYHDAVDFNPVYNIQDDPWQTTPIHDDELEAKLAEKMRQKMVEYDAPECQFVRMGFCSESVNQYIGESVNQ